MTKRSPLPVWVVVACCVVLGQFRALTLLGFAPAGKHEESSSSFQSEESALTRGTLGGVRDRRFQDGMPLNPFNLSVFSMDIFAAKESARRKPKSTSSNSRKKRKALAADEPKLGRCILREFRQVRISGGLETSGSPWSL